MKWRLELVRLNVAVWALGKMFAAGVMLAAAVMWNATARRVYLNLGLGITARSLRCISTVRGNDKGSYFEKEPHQSELHN